MPANESPTLRIVHCPDGDRARLDVVRDGLTFYNLARTGIEAYFALNEVLEDDAGAVVGGVVAHAWGRWLHVTDVWIAPTCRGRGWARRLLGEVERRAVACGCTDAHLDSFSFQAPEMYRKLGYEVFGVLEDHPTGHRQFFLHKRLAPVPA